MDIIIVFAIPIAATNSDTALMPEDRLGSYLRSLGLFEPLHAAVGSHSLYLIAF